MKKCNRKRKENNKGFSLVEVLCAIVLLGLVAAPFLQMIYSSYATNLKSKKYLAASDLCQTIMEGVSSQTYEDSKTVGTSTQTVTGVGNYYFPDSSHGSKLGNKGLYGSPSYTSEPKTIPQGNCNSNPDGDAFSGSDKTAYFKDITYAGYKFNVTITAKESGLYPSTKTYFTVPIEVAVYDAESSSETFISSHLSSFSKLQTASTRIPNKR